MDEFKKHQPNELQDEKEKSDNDTATVQHSHQSFFAKAKEYLISRLALKPPIHGDPRDFSFTLKTTVLLCVSMAGMLPGFCSTIYFPALPEVQRDLNASQVAVTCTLSLFILFMGIAPLVWASFSDYYHIRRWIYLFSLLVFVASSLGSAFVQNIWVLLVLRCIQSFGASAAPAVGAGSVADCWAIKDRGSKMGLFFVGNYIGPLVGPIIGGFLTTSFGWRSTFYFCAAFGFMIFAIMFFFVPETYRVEELYLPLDDPKRSNVIATNKGKPMNPFESVYLLRHNFIFIVSLETGLAFATMFTFETLIPDIFSGTYGLNSSLTGLTYLGGGTGNILGSYIGGRLSDIFLRRATVKRGGTTSPEDRLSPNVYIGGGIILPLGILLFGWAVWAHYIIAVPILGFGLICFGMMQILMAGSTYLVDAVPGKGASATAAAGLFRMVLACILSIVATPWNEATGVQWLSVLLAGLNILGTGSLLYLKSRGERLRERAGL